MRDVTPRIPPPASSTAPPQSRWLTTTRAERIPRSVFCVVDHLHRNPAVAETVCAGRFRECGITLTLGPEPDWLGSGVAEDVEWRFEWSKFAYGLDLAHAFAASGERRFQRAWERLVLSWIRQVPVGFDPSEVSARRLQNWIYAWNRFAAAGAFRGLTEGAADQIYTSITEQILHLRAHLTPGRNHRTLELYALFITALAFTDMPDGDALLEFAVEELHRNLLSDVRADGVHREASTHYHLIALRTFLGARENGRRFGVEFSEDYDRHLERACEFALHCHRPDGHIPALSDADTGDYSDLLRLAASLLGRPDFLYAGTAGRRGTPPTRRYVSFPEAGYFTQRSGWGNRERAFRDERFLILDCGPLGDGGHGHYDLLSVEISAGGRALVLDPGRYTYSEAAPNWRRWFKSTAAHNTVCVDGHDQTAYAVGKPRGPVAQGRLLTRVSTPGLDALWAEARSPAYDAVHTRGVIFVGDDYWIIVDRLRGTRRHRYDLRFHLAPEAWGRATAAIDGDNTTIWAPGLALVMSPPRAASIEPGWMSPEYGTKLPAPVVSVVVEDDSADFFTLVVPMADARRSPVIRVSDDEANATVAHVGGVGAAGTRDVVGWSPTPVRFSFAPVDCRAHIAWLRTSTLGEPLAFVAGPGSEVTEESGGDTTWVSWNAATTVVRESGGAP